MPLDEKAVRVKVRYYLGTFAAYFIVCFILVKLIDISKIGKKITKKLHDSAYASKLYTPRMSHQELHDSWCAVKNDTKSKRAVFNKLMGRDYKISKIVHNEAQFKGLSDMRSEASMRFLKTNRLGKDSGYSEGFYSYIDQRRTFLGCEPLLFNDGKVQACCWDFIFIKSAIEDFILYVCNNHSFLSCLYACEGAPVDHTGYTLIYTTQLCIAFFMSAISGSVLNYLQMPNAANIVFDIIVTTPATITIAKIMRILYVCPVCFSVTYQATHPRIVWMLKCLGKIAILPIIAAIITLLISAAIFSRGHSTVYILLYFLLQVQLYGFFLELTFSGLLFLSSFYMRSTIDLRYRSIVLLEIGRRFTEVIYHGNMVENKDYHYRCYYVFWILRIECIYRFEDAVKKGYVKEEERIQDDVEMTESNQYRPSNSLQYSLYKQPSFFTAGSVKTIMKSMMTNSVATNLIKGEVIYNENDETGSDFRAYNAQLPAQLPALSFINPMHAIGGTDTFRSNLQMFDREIATEDDGYDGNMIVRAVKSQIPGPIQDDYILTDEELILQRKEFKEGTRNSFIEVFRKFEGDEQLKSVHTSAGRTNQMQYLFNKNKKNILDTRK